MKGNTTAIQKLSVSVISTAIVLLISLPIYLIEGFTIKYKIAVVIIFLLYNLFFAIFFKGQTLGQRILKINWVKEYPLKNHLIFSFLYTLSFSTIFIWIFFPFDLLLFNLLLIQLPCVLITGYTLHGYLSGKMKGSKI
jgi:hypothetical protein